MKLLGALPEYLSSWYWKIKQRRGAKKALVALARKLLVIIYNLLKNNTDYDETSFEKAKQKQEKFRVKKWWGLFYAYDRLNFYLSSRYSSLPSAFNHSLITEPSLG